MRIAHGYQAICSHNYDVEGTSDTVEPVGRLSCDACERHDLRGHKVYHYLCIIFYGEDTAAQLEVGAKDTGFW